MSVTYRKVLFSNCSSNDNFQEREPILVSFLWQKVELHRSIIQIALKHEIRGFDDKPIFGIAMLRPLRQRESYVCPECSKHAFTKKKKKKNIYIYINFKLKLQIPQNSDTFPYISACCFKVVRDIELKHFFFFLQQRQFPFHPYIIHCVLDKNNMCK